MPSESEKVRYAVVSRAHPVPILPAPSFPAVDLSNIRYPLNSHMTFSSMPSLRCGKLFSDTTALDADPVTIDQHLFPNSASDFSAFVGMRPHYDPQPVQPFATIPNCYLQTNFNFNLFTYPPRMIPTVDADFAAYLNNSFSWSGSPSDPDPIEPKKDP